MQKENVMFSYQSVFSVWCRKGRVQSVTDAPIEEVVQLVEGRGVIVEVGGRLKHPVDISLPRAPQYRRVSPEVEGPLMEEDRVKVGH